MTAAFSVRSVSSAKAIDPKVWNGLANPDGARFDPFLTHDFFVALEDSGSAVPEAGWGAMHLVAEDQAGAVVGLMPLYLKGHSQGEYVFDHGWAQGYDMAGGRYYPKLLCGVPFTPVSGRRLWAEGPRPLEISRCLLSGAIDLVKQRGLSSLHINFIDPALAAPLRGAGLEELGFLLRTGTQFHWQDQGYETFDGFLASLQSRKRKALKKERRQALANDLQIEWVEGDAITPAHWHDFYQFYLDTSDRKWGTPYLTKDFFSQIGTQLADQLVFVFARSGEQRVAGALNFKGSDTLYGRYWGALEHHPFLHFEVCYYQAIDYALANGLSRVEAGAQGEHKLLRGYAPCQTLSAHYIADESFRLAVKDFLEEETRHMALHGEALRGHLPFKKQ